MRDASSQDSTASFSDALRAAIAERGVSLEWLRRRLAALGTPLSVATLSYWRSGRSQPEHQTSLDALEKLEDLLYLPTGHLRSRLRPSRRTGRGGGRASLAELMGHSEAVRNALVQLGYEPDDAPSLVQTSTQVTFDVDGEGRGRSAVTRSVWKAVRDGARTHPFLFRLPRPGGSVPEFVGLQGCAIGKTHADVQSGIFGMDVVLERSLLIGETAISEHQVLMPAEAEADPFHELYLTRRMAEVVLWVRFDPDRLPRHCEAFIDDTRTVGTRMLPLRGTTSAHHVARNFGPGKLGIRWRW